MAKKNPTVRYEYVSPHCGLVRILSEFEDPRRDHGKQHKLEDALTIALCTILTGHSEFTEVEIFGELREDWLDRFLELPVGIPSPDTSRNLFCAIDPESFLELFARWTCCVRDKTSGELVGFDGKALRCTKGGPDNMRTVVGVWAAGTSISLGQVDVEGEGNEWERTRNAQSNLSSLRQLCHNRIKKEQR